MVFSTIETLEKFLYETLLTNVYNEYISTLNKLKKWQNLPDFSSKKSYDDPYKIQMKALNEKFEKLRKLHKKTVELCSFKYQELRPLDEIYKDAQDIETELQEFIYYEPRK